jgi:hypothetical protein
MKKQLLIVLMAFFAIGLSSTYGQVTCPIPRAVDPVCLPANALHPIAGNPYDYSISVPTPPGTKEYTWFVTQDSTFIAAGVLTANRETSPGTHIAATGPGYNNPATGSPTLTITWKSFVYDPYAPVFVVIHVKNTASTPDACISNNVKVFKILPLNAFTLDIANVTAAGVASGYETPIDRCIHDIVSAKYFASSPDSVLYDFGVDYLYYVVTAANFSTSWKPSVQITGMNVKDSVTAVVWALPTDFAFVTSHPMPRVGITYTSTDPVPVVNGTFVGSAGECILIRVTIDHTTVGRQYQGLTDEVITLAVDGITAITATPPIPDVHYSSTLPVANSNCGLPDGFLFPKFN